MPRRRRAEEDPDEDDCWEGPPDFSSPMAPTVIHVPEGPEGVIGFKGKPKPLHSSRKKK